MPFYAFDCRICGPFTAMRPMAESADPGACPECGGSAPRSLSAPAILRGPARVAADAGAAAGGAEPPLSRAAHPAGCGCCVRRSPALDSLAAAGGRVFTSSGPRRAEGL
ncbi:FmdB family zinc ribbon protein [Phenylobacterium sp.]|uniref:FmdB family zinc ribbon protein n=1 Tax=Phenylobacterium sp. TaxID=1871053 RepID=UPI0035B4D3FF